MTPQEWAEEFNRRLAGTMIASHGPRFVEVPASVQGRLLAPVTTTPIVPGH